MVNMTQDFQPWMLNELMRNPDIYSTAAERKLFNFWDPRKIDFTTLLSDANVRMFVGLDGVVPTGFCQFHKKGLVRWEIHTGWRRDYRGLWARKGVEAALGEMFKHGVQVITAEIPETNKPCLALAGAIGFERIGVYDDAWDVGDGTLCGVALVELTRKKWGR